jgi:hypothetical protein
MEDQTVNRGGDFYKDGRRSSSLHGGMAGTIEGVVAVFPMH